MSLKQYSIVLFVLIPLVFMNLTHSHDWGDDFALYLMQSDQLVEFSSPLHTGYIFNPDYPLMAPPAYPPGFPLLLTVVSFFRPESLLPYMMFMNVFGIGFGIFLCAFFSRYFSFITALICTSIIVYNPWFVGFKSEILSDLPFAMFFILGFYFLEQRKYYLLAGLVIGFCISTRSIGVAIPVGILLYMMVSTMKNYIHEKGFNIKSRENIYFMKVILVVIPFYFLNILFTKSGYTSIFLSADVWNTIKINADYYFVLIRSYLDLSNDYVPYFGLVFKVIFFSLFFFGFLTSIVLKRRVMDYIFIVYLLVLILYPYHLTGFRFVLPVFPFVMIYAVEALFRFNAFTKISVLNFQITAFVIFAIIYSINITQVNIDAHKMKPGPCEPQAIETFNYIRKNTDEKSIIIFSKPKALAYFTKRKSISNNPQNGVKEIYQLIKNYNCNYILLHSGNGNSPMERYAKLEKGKLKLVWKNESFTLLLVPHSLSQSPY